MTPQGEILEIESAGSVSPPAARLGRQFVLRPERGEQIIIGRDAGWVAGVPIVLCVHRTLETRIVHGLPGKRILDGDRRDDGCRQARRGSGPENTRGYKPR